MSAATVSYAMPMILRVGERVSRRALRLEHGANVLPLGHVVCYFGLLALALTDVLPASPFIAAPVVVLLTLLNFSLTIGVLHMHAHRPLFVQPRLNRLVDVACCLPGWLSAAEMRTVHVVNHHRFNDGPGDVTSTATYESGGRALWYWLRYGTIVRRFTAQQLFLAELPEGRRRRRRSFVADVSFVFVTVVALTTVLPTQMLLYYWVPFVITQLSSGYFAWLTHAPVRDREGPSASINTVGNVLNLFIFNQGYHSVHHRYPGIHWTEIPDKLRYMLDVDPDVIVPYWVTLNTAWRIVAPERFRNARFGTRWQARLERRLAQGSVRSRVLPWFTWI